MNHRRSKRELVLSIYPSAKGFGFAVFDGSRSLVDWGVKGIRGGKGKNAESLRKVRELLAFYRCDILAVRSYAGAGSRQGARIEKLLTSIVNVARQEDVRIVGLSRADVQSSFEARGARTKRRIAETIAREFPELEPRLPPVRRIWMSEDARMSIFDAVALGMTFFHIKQMSRRAA